MSVRDRIKSFCDSQNITISAFEKSINVSNGYVNSISKSIGIEKISTIIENYSNLDIEWLLTGNGTMFRSEGGNVSVNLIPLYDDVSTIGGKDEMRASPDGISQPTEYIDAGDWFKDATAAIRHYGESMVEYPQGCILALKEVKDRTLVVPGRDYVIETTEYRVTKRIKISKDKQYLIAYSTNEETYKDGSLVHEPFDILFQDIVRIFLVLGYVVKKNGGTMVFNNKK